MSTFKKHNHEQNQTGYKQPMVKPSKAGTQKTGGIAPPRHSTKGSRKTESAVSPDTDTSNGGM